MKKILAMILGTALSHSALAANTTINAQKLHDSKCMSCHNTDVYTNSDRRVKSLAALSHQVNNCMKGPAGASWSDAETHAVVEYLNSKFYKF